MGVPEVTASGIWLQVPVSHHDLLSDPHTAILTTVDREFHPQSTAVFFLVDKDGVLRGSVTSDRQKYRNLIDNPSCSLFVLDPTNRHRTLEVRANVELAPDPEMLILKEFAVRYNRDYEIMARSGNRHRIAMTFNPIRIISFPSPRRSA